MSDAETTAVYFDSGTSTYKGARPPLSDNRHRVYDPFTASYLQADPEVASSWNTYAYAENSPVMTSDESGLLSCFLGGCDSGPSADEIKKCEELFEYLAWLLHSHYFYLANPTPHGQDLAWKYYSTYLEIKRMYEGVFGCVPITGPAPAIYENWQVPFLGGEQIPDQAGVLESASDPLRDITTEPMPRQGPVLAPVRQVPRGELSDDLGFSIRPTRRQ